MDMVPLDHIGLVTAGTGKQFRSSIHCGGKHIHADREIRCPDQRRAALLEIGEDLAPDIIPTGRSDHGGLEMIRDAFVIGPERSRHREIDAYRILGDGRIEVRNVLAGPGTFDTASGQHLFNHMAHFAISGDNNLHIKQTILHVTQ